MDPNNGSGSRTRSGLVRGNAIIVDPNEESCSKTRSGLVRVKNIVGSSEGSSSRTRSGFARVNNSVDSSEGSHSKTRSGLVRRNIAMDSNDGSCSKTRSGLVRGKAAMDCNEESPSKTRSELVGGNTAMDSSKDSYSTTRSGLVRISPSFKVENKDEPVIKRLPDERCEAENPGKHGSNQSNDLVQIKNAPVIKGPDGCLDEDIPVKDRLNYKPDQVQSKDEPVMKGPDGWWKEEIPTKNGSRHTTDLVQIKDDLDSTGQLPVGWWREDRPRKNGTTNKIDPYYIDPVSGYEFRSLKDVQRYVKSGDITKCNVRPKKRNIQDVCITQNQAHTSASSKYTRPGTADKAIQCELLTEGIMPPREELFSAYTENAMIPEFEVMKPMQRYANKADPLKHKSARPVSAQRATGGKKPVKRKEPSAEVKPRKRKITSKEKIATPPRASSRIAALKVYPEGNAEPGDEPTSVDLFNQVWPIQEETADDSQFSQANTVIQTQTNQKSIANHNQLQSSQADTIIPMQINDEGTANQLQLSRADAPTKIQTKQEKTVIHVQSRRTDTINPSQTNHEDTVNQLHSCQADTAIRIQTNQESTANQLPASRAETTNQMHAMQEYTTSYSQLSKADTMNRKKTNQGNTARELQSSHEKIIIPVQTGQEYFTNHSRWQQSHGHTVNPIQANPEHATNQLNSSQADTVMKIQTTQEYFSNHSEPRRAGAALNHMQINQETMQLQLGQADAVKQMRTMQENSTNQLIQALTVDKKQTTHEYFSNHPKRIQSDNVNHMQINQENSAYQKQSQRVNVNHMQINQGNSAYQLPSDRANSLNQIANTTSRSQLIQGLTVNQIQAIRENNTRYLQPRYAENPIGQSGFSRTPERGHGAPVTNFWENGENQKSSNPAKIEASPTATSSASFQRQYAPAQEPVLPTQAAMPKSADPSGFGLSLFGSSWSDPCIEFAFKTLTGDIPVLDDSPAVQDHFPLQHDLNKIAPPDYSAPSVDDTRNAQFDHGSHHSVQRPSDRFYNGGWFPPQ